MSLQAKRAPLPLDYYFPVHSCGCPSCVSRLTPELRMPDGASPAPAHGDVAYDYLSDEAVCRCGARRRLGSRTWTPKPHA